MAAAEKLDLIKHFKEDYTKPKTVAASLGSWPRI